MTSKLVKRSVSYWSEPILNSENLWNIIMLFWNAKIFLICYIYYLCKRFRIGRFKEQCNKDSCNSYNRCYISSTQLINRIIKLTNTDLINVVLVKNCNIFTLSCCMYIHCILSKEKKVIALLTKKSSVILFLLNSSSWFRSNWIFALWLQLQGSSRRKKVLNLSTRVMSFQWTWQNKLNWCFKRKQSLHCNWRQPQHYY